MVTIARFISLWAGSGGYCQRRNTGHHQFPRVGGKETSAWSITQLEVQRVLIQNGKATGVKLLDGTEVTAKQLVCQTTRLLSFF